MTEQKFHVGVKALVRNEAGDILVLKANPATFYNKKDKAHWDLPGGRINEGGGVKQTLERELGEELGIKGKDLKIGRLFDGGISNITLRVGSEKVGLVLLVYECFIRNSKGLRLSNEHLEYKWAMPEDAVKLLAYKFAKTFIRKLEQQTVIAQGLYERGP